MVMVGVSCSCSKSSSSLSHCDHAELLPEALKTSAESLNLSFDGLGRDELYSRIIISAGQSHDFAEEVVGEPDIGEPLSEAGDTTLRRLDSAGRSPDSEFRLREMHSGRKSIV